MSNHEEMRLTPLPPQAPGSTGGVLPLLSDAGLDPTEAVPVLDQRGVRREVPTATEQALTIKVDGDELVTLMTIGAQPELLVLGYLRNQGLVRSIDEVATIAVEWERELAEVTTRAGRGVHAPLKVTAPPPVASSQSLHRDDIHRVVNLVSEHNTVYRTAGSVHGCGLVEDGRMLFFCEDVARHNATDAIAGWMWMNRIEGDGKILYSTGRLTTEIVAKTALMGIAVLVSRNGVTHSAVELARDVGVMLVARARGRGFQVFSCQDRLVHGERS